MSCRYCDYFWDSVATVCGLHIWIKCYVKVASCTWAAYLPLFSRLYKRLVGSVRNQTFVFCPPTNSCLLPIGLFAPVLLCSKFTKMGQQFEAKTYFLQESVRKKSAIIVNTSFVQKQYVLVELYIAFCLDGGYFDKICVKSFLPSHEIFDFIFVDSNPSRP